MKKIAILGSTGSIGTQTLDIVREQGDIQVVAMAAGSNISLLEAQMREFKPSLVSVWDEKKASELRTNTKDLGIKIVSGMEGLLEVSVIPESEILVTAIVGMLGIRPTIAAIKAGKKIALANKETLSLPDILLFRLQRNTRCRFFRWTANTVRFSSRCRVPGIIRSAGFY